MAPTVRAFALLAAFVVSGCSRSDRARKRAMPAFYSETFATGQVPGAPDPDAAVVSPQAMALPPALPEISAPMRIHGELTPTDLRVPGVAGYADHFVLRLRAGQAVTVVARAEPERDPTHTVLDMYLALFHDRQMVCHDDDSASTSTALNARMMYTAPAEGMYVLRVTIWGGAQQPGFYELQVYDGELRSQQ